MKAVRDSIFENEEIELKFRYSHHIIPDGYFGYSFKARPHFQDSIIFIKRKDSAKLSNEAKIKLDSVMKSLGL